MRYPPCKKSGVNCEKRYPGCHSKCKEYKDYKKLVEGDRILRAKQKAEQDALMGSPSFKKAYKNSLKYKK